MHIHTRPFEGVLTMAHMLLQQLGNLQVEFTSRSRIAVKERALTLKSSRDI